MLKTSTICAGFILILPFLGPYARDVNNVAGAGSQPRTVSKITIPAELSSHDWSSIRAAYEAGRHSSFPIDGGYRFRNPGQQWNTQFDGRGFSVEPDRGNWSWGLELKSYGTLQNERIISGKAYTKCNGQTISYNWGSNLTEWYKNDARGLEHGYTVHSRPAPSNGNGNGTLTLNLGVRGDLDARVQSGRDVQFVNDDGVSILNYSNLTVFDTNGKILPARFDSAEKQLCILIDDTNAQYPITVDPTAQQAYLKSSNSEAGDFFGETVAISGDTVVVGCWHEDSNATGINGGQANNSASNSGAAYVFVRNGTTWSQQAYLKASNAQVSDEFGYSVAISGDTVVVCARAEDSNATGVDGNQANNSAVDSGAAYIFVRNGTTWSQQAYLKASNCEAGDFFGTAVAVSGDTVVIGVYQESSNAVGVNGDGANNSAFLSGAAYVFVRSGVTWGQQAYLKASNTGGGDNFGFSVAISGDTIVVGARSEDSNATGVNGNQADNSVGSSGAAYVFVRSGVTWSQQAYLKASNTGNGDFFGSSVAISGDSIVVGAWSEDSSATGINGNQADDSAANSGAAYIFERSGITWGQQAYLKASNAEGGDNLGVSVAISGTTVVVGARSEDSNATGVNGNQADNSVGSSGAAYVFVRNGATWSQQAYLKASNPGVLDNFGIPVAISGDTIVAGALNEDSNAVGINGNQANNSAADSGAAYIFDLDNNSGTLSYGTGTPGCSGTHTLDVTHAPMINSPHFAITCSNAPPLSMGLGIVTDSQDLAGSNSLGLGVLIHSDFIFATELLTFDFFSDGAGYSETVGTGIPNDNNLIGKTFYACALWAWPTSTCILPGFNPYNLSTSRGLAITILVP